MIQGAKSTVFIKFYRSQYCINFNSQTYDFIQKKIFSQFWVTATNISRRTSEIFAKESGGCPRDVFSDAYLLNSLHFLSLLTPEIPAQPFQIYEHRSKVFFFSIYLTWVYVHHKKARYWCLYFYFECPLSYISNCLFYRLRISAKFFWYMFYGRSLT